MSRLERTRDITRLIAVLLTLAACTLVTLVLESPAVGVEDASPIYLVAVVAAGTVGGNVAGGRDGHRAFVVYDFLFTEPRCR